MAISSAQGDGAAIRQQPVLADLRRMTISIVVGIHALLLAGLARYWGRHTGYDPFIFIYCLLIGALSIWTARALSEGCISRFAETLAPWRKLLQFLFMAASLALYRGIVDSGLDAVTAVK